MGKKGRVTLNEIMGKSGEKNDFSIEDLPDLLGEKMPKLEYHPLGRVRLIRALSMRFGPGYRNIPGIVSILKEFDDKYNDEMIIQKIKNASRRNE